MNEETSPPPLSQAIPDQVSHAPSPQIVSVRFVTRRTRVRRAEDELDKRFAEIEFHLRAKRLPGKVKSFVWGLLWICEETRLVRPQIQRQDWLILPCLLDKTNLSHARKDAER